MTVDASDNAIVAGIFHASNTTANFGGGPVAATSSQDAFVAKYTSRNTYVWARHFGGNDYVTGNNVSVNASAIAMTGTFSGSNVNFGNGILTSTSGSNDIFLLTLAP